MKNIPYKICPYHTAGQFATLECPDRQLNFLTNLLIYRKYNVVSDALLYKLSEIINVDRTSILWRIQKYKDYDKLSIFCQVIRQMYRYNFINTNDFRLLCIEANRQTRSLLQSTKTFSNARFCDLPILNNTN